MTLEWYSILVIVLLGIIVFAIIIIIIKKCCCKRDRKGSYSGIAQVELAEEPREILKNTHESFVLKSDDDVESGSSFQNSPIHKLGNVSNVSEVSAEISCSDIDLEPGGTVSAYGDTASMFSVASKASWLTINTVSNLNLSVQASLIYAQDMRYVAGKIIQVEGLTFGKHTPPSHVRVHVVVLPVKKYAMKTNWYEIQSNGKVRIEEYFKYVFKLPPSDTRTMFRIRVYGRRMKVGSLGRASCMGECYINLMEIISSRGGLTVWRTLSRGIPQAIIEGQLN